MVPLANSIPGRYAGHSPSASLRRTPFRAPSVIRLMVRLEGFTPFPSAREAQVGLDRFLLPGNPEGSGESNGHARSGDDEFTPVHNSPFMIVSAERLESGFAMAGDHLPARFSANHSRDAPGRRNRPELAGSSEGTRDGFRSVRKRADGVQPRTLTGVPAARRPGDRTRRPARSRWRAMWATAAH